jgi:hypothetical protein
MATCPGRTASMPSNADAAFGAMDSMGPREPRAVERSFHAGEREDRLRLRGDDHVPGRPRDEERLDSEPVAYGHEPLLASVPKHERELAFEVRESVEAVGTVEAEHDLRVGTMYESRPPAP